MCRALGVDEAKIDVAARRHPFDDVTGEGLGAGQRVGDERVSPGRSSGDEQREQQEP